MSQVLIALSGDLELILDEIRLLIQQKAQHQLRMQLGSNTLNIVVPLGRPKKVFKLTPAQVREANELLKRGKVKQSEAYVQGLKDDWIRARGEEDALRELAKQEALERLSLKRTLKAQRPAKASTLANLLETLLPKYRDTLRVEVAALPPIPLPEEVVRELKKEAFQAPRPRVFDTSGVKAVSPKKKTR